MADVEEINMADEFPRWYKEVALEDPRETLPLRWKGVVALSQEAKWDDVDAMIRVVFNTAQRPDKDIVNKICTYFKKEDVLFDIVDNEREFQILCCATLAEIFKLSDEVALKALLGVVVAECVSERKPIVPIDISGFARNELTDRAARVRERPDLNLFSRAKFPKIAFDEAIKKIRETNDFEAVSAAFEAVGASSQKSLSFLIGKITKTFEDACKYFAVQDEELQILWWLTGGRSWDLKCKFSDVPDSAKPLVIAKELAFLTVVVPGANGINGILERAGLGLETKVSIPEAVNSCHAAWLEQLISSEVSPVIFPIHHAINSKLKTNDDSSWVGFWSSATGILSESRFASLDLGMLFYQERLLLKMVEEQV